MPDHIHLFAGLAGTDIRLDNWVRYWKSQFTKGKKGACWRWAAGHWDTRMRNEKQYEEKWFYVRENPVRHGLADGWEQWPFSGEVFTLSW